METIINITELGAYKNTLTGNTYNFKTGSCTIKKLKSFSILTVMEGYLFPRKHFTKITLK
jgi:hypothetical protein